MKNKQLKDLCRIYGRTEDFYTVLFNAISNKLRFLYYESNIIDLFTTIYDMSEAEAKDVYAYWLNNIFPSLYKTDKQDMHEIRTGIVFETFEDIPDRISKDCLKQAFESLTKELSLLEQQIKNL